MLEEGQRGAHLHSAERQAAANHVRATCGSLSLPLSGRGASRRQGGAPALGTRTHPLPTHRPLRRRYGSAFEVISTFSPNWPNNATGGPAYKQTCSTGIYTNCYSAGCRRMAAAVSPGAPDTLCYCPVVSVKASDPKTVFTMASEGASCSGSKGLAVGGTVWVRAWERD